MKGEDRLKEARKVAREVLEVIRAHPDDPEARGIIDRLIAIAIIEGEQRAYKEALDAFKL